MKRWCFNSFLIVILCLPPGLKAQVVNHFWPITLRHAVTLNNGNYHIDSNSLPVTINHYISGRNSSLLNCDSDLIFYSNYALRAENDSVLGVDTYHVTYALGADDDHNYVYVLSIHNLFNNQSRLNQITLTYDTNFNLLASSRSQLLNSDVHDYEITKKASGNGYWIILMNRLSTEEELFVYSWENGQISPQYVDSLRLRNIHPFLFPGLQGNRPGMVMNLQGNKIAVKRKAGITGNFDGVWSFLKFDAHTGNLHDEIQIDLTSQIFIYPLLFSPDGDKFFFYKWNGNPALYQLDLTIFDSIQATNSFTQLVNISIGNSPFYYVLAAYANQSDIALIASIPHITGGTQGRLVVHEIQNANLGPSGLVIDTSVHDFGNILAPISFAHTRPYQLPQLFLPNRFNIRAPAEACPNDSVAPVLGDYLNVRNVRWNFGDGSAEQTKRFPKHAYSQPGTYNITAYFQHCSNLDTVYHQITILDTPASLALPDTVFCAGSTLPLQVQPIIGQQYLWSTGDSLPNTNISSGGWHWLEQRNACFSRRDSFYVAAQLPPQAGLPLDTNLCEGDVLVLSPQAGAYSWQWQDGSTQPLQVNQSGTYALLMTNACGTFVHQCRVVFRQAPAFELKDTSRCEGQFFRVELPEFWQANYQWSDGVSERIRVLTDSGAYEVRISNPCGESSSTMYLQLSDCVCHIYLPTAFSPNGDGLNDQLTVATRCALSSYEMEVYDRWGRLLFRSNQLDRGWDGYFNGQLLPPGAYPFVIRYTPEGRNARLEKGVVHLIR